MKINYDSDICQHAGVCVTKFPHIYSVEDGQFVINSSATTDEELAMSIAQCPSGAISSTTED